MALPSKSRLHEKRFLLFSTTRALVAASLANFPPAVNSSATCKAWDRLCRPTAGTAKSDGRYCELRYANHRTPLLAAVKLFAATVR